MSAVSHVSFYSVPPGCLSSGLSRLPASKPRSERRLIYFSDTELRCKCGCGAVELQEGFAEALDNLRAVYGYPMIPNSACRCPDHNRMVGGHHNSLHLTFNPHWNTKTCAIDVARPSADRLGTLVEVALRRGFSVGLAPTFVHLDWRSQCCIIPADRELGTVQHKPPVLWTY